VRFLVLEANRRPNLASKVLAHALKALPGQWHEEHGYEPLLASTFTDADGSAQGTCYKACNWQLVGQTKGFSRVSVDFYEVNGKPKHLWVRPLRPDALERLRAPELAPEHAAAQTEGKGAPSPLPASQLRTLGTIVTLCDTDEKVPVAIAAAPCGGELESARRLLSRESTCLLNAVVSGDALYTNSDNVRLVVMENGGNVLLSVKGNQPTLERETLRVLEDAPFLP